MNATALLGPELNDILRNTSNLERINGDKWVARRNGSNRTGERVKRGNQQ